MAENRNGVPEVDAATLAPLVRGLLEGDAALDGPWSIRPLQGGYGGQGLYRFAGDARIGNETRPWSVVLKTTPAPQRGALTYSFGFLAQLPGPLMAPRCLRLTTRPDGRTWLWLKEIIDECPGPWDLGRFALAAQHLGRFKGAWLVAGALANDAWLSRHWLRRYVAAEGVAAAILDIAPDAPPLLRQYFPPWNVARIRRLQAEREVFLPAALGRLPQTICHHDAFPVTCSLGAGATGRSRRWPSIGRSPGAGRWGPNWQP